MLQKPLTILICSAILTLTSGLGGYGQSAALQALHLSVQVRQLSGTPMRGLRPRDFAVTEDGLAVPVSAVGQSSAVSMLVLYSARSGVTTVAAGLAALRSVTPPPIMDAGIAVRVPDGSTLDYSAALAGWRNASADAAGISRTSLDEALRTLAKRSGRRAVVYVVGAYENAPPEIAQAAKEMGALVYQVGGNMMDNFTSWGEQTTTGDLPIYGAGLNGNFAPNGGGFHVVNNTELWENHATPAIRTMHVEKTFAAAFRDIRGDSRGWYDLTVPLPSPASRINLRLRHQPEYQISAEISAAPAEKTPELSVGKP